jgi:hypothetical protein
VAQQPSTNPPASGWGYSGPPALSPVASVPTHMVWAVISIFLFWPTAIAAIVYAAKVAPALASGDVAGARRASGLAKRFSWISLAVCVGIVLIAVVAALASGGSSTY